MTSHFQMTSQMFIVGAAIILAFLALWWVTARIGTREREKDNLSAAMSRENSELRYVVTEMAKERHHLDDGPQSKRLR